MRISIYCIGKLKESYWREAIAEYAKDEKDARSGDMDERNRPDNHSDIASI